MWLMVKTKTEKVDAGFVYVESEIRSEANKEKFNRWND